MLKSIFILSQSEEMRVAYTEALKTQCDEARWFSSYDALLKAAAGPSPAAVIVDLDSIEERGATSLEGIRTHFSESDLLALSSNDSAGAAMNCLRSGCSDFLVKPLSPEELSWALRKAQQRREMERRFDNPRAAMIRTVTRISACTSPTLVQLGALEFLKSFLGARGIAWLKPASVNPSVVLSLPTGTHPQRILWRLPTGKQWVTRPHSFILRNKRSGGRKIFIPCSDPSQGLVFLWGVKKSIGVNALADAALIVRHAEMSLLNLTKFEEIRQQTFLDDLTGLYNSRYLRYALENAFLRCKSGGAAKSFSVLFIDVDHFKSVNDRHGHLVGSEFLVAISRTIKNTVRQVDAVFRYGGDEFVVILQDTGMAKAREVAERIRSHVEKREFVIGATRVQTTVSIGLAVYPDTASNLEELLHLADSAMYSVKKATRNAVQLASPAPRKPEQSAV